MMTPPPPIDPQALLSPVQAAAVLGVSGTTFQRIVGTGEIPFYCLGKRRKYRREELLAYVEGRRRFESPPSVNLAPPAEIVKPRAVQASKSSLAATLDKSVRKGLNPFADKLRRMAEGGAS